MRLRTFTAPDMQRAMVMIRETMGEDAVIIATTRENGGKSVSVTAALEEEVASSAEQDAWNGRHEEPDESEQPVPGGGLGQYLAATARRKQANQNHAPAKDRVADNASLMSRDAILKNRDLAYLLHELEQILNFHSVPAGLVEKMMRAAKHLDVRYARSLDGVHDALCDLLDQLYAFAPLELHGAGGKAQRIMLVGPPGVGKTLAVAKIAADLVADDLPIHVVTIDNRKAGSVEQLRAFTHIMGLDTEVTASRAELRQALRDYPADEPVIVDSFGTNPYSFDELKELTDFANLHGIEPVLVLAAGVDAQEAADVAQAFRFLGIRRLLVTRTDTARRMGAILSAANACELALCNITTSPQVAGGFMPLSAEAVSDVLMQHRKDH
jgi:flagellar biosynthesis protein FlhF